jgi:hypothetical protein
MGALAPYFTHILRAYLQMLVSITLMKRLVNILFDMR